MPILVPKIVWPSGGANELLFAFPPVNVKPFDQQFRRHDTVASSGERQSLLERVDKFLELDITLVPTEAEQYLTRVEEFDHADWGKFGNGGAAAPTVTPNVVANPMDEAVTADQIDFPVTTGGQSSDISQTSTPPEVPGRSMGESIWIRANSQLTLAIYLSDNPFSENAASIIPLDVLTTWKRIFLAGTFSLTANAGTKFLLRQPASQAAKTVFVFGAQLHYGLSMIPYVKTQGAIPAAIDRWDAFIAAVRDGTNFDYYPDAFAGGNTTYVLEDKRWRPKLQVRGANRFYEFKLKLREYI